MVEDLTLHRAIAWANFEHLESIRLFAHDRMLNGPTWSGSSHYYVCRSSPAKRPAGFLDNLEYSVS
jgi:hypothetical protein